ncbi:MAG: hypothetical protein WAW92_02345 [Minisyncoccia bacterium]
MLFTNLPTSLRIGVIRGGSEPMYDTSIKTGAYILKNLSQTHNPIDIFISKGGDWYVQGIQRSPDRILKNIDVVLNSLHGNFGEDGGIQEILNNHGVKYVGSDRLSSAFAMNRHLAKEKLFRNGVKTPVFSIVKKGEDILLKARQIWNSLIHPFAVKPGKGGSAFGFAIANSFEELVGIISELSLRHDVVLVEEFIPGVSVSCLVTENLRDSSLYAFPPSTQLKYEQAQEVENLAKKVHQILELSHLSQSDFIIAPKRGVYFLEVDTSPKIAEKSLANKSLESVGISTNDFLHHLIRLRLNE